MLSSISPFGERSRHSRWWVTVSAYIVGSVAGGATTGLVLGVAGEALRAFVTAEAALVVFAVLAFVGVLAEGGRLGLRIPSVRRQVNEDWLGTYRGWVYGLGFGFQLGLGVATIVTTSTVWLSWAAAVLVGSWAWGLAIGAWFGLCRGAAILVTARVDSPAELRALFRRIEAGAPHVQRVAALTAGLAGVTAMAGLVS